MKEVQNEQLFQELDNEVAATCSGGVAYLYDRDSVITFPESRVLVVSNSQPDLRRVNFNDKTSLVKITGNERWAFYKDINFKGKPLILGPGQHDLSKQFAGGSGWNNSISSLKRIS
jgi:hypothetical protein